MAKQWTDEERKAFGEKMKAKRAERLAAKAAEIANQPPEIKEQLEQVNSISQDDYQSLLKQIEELKAMQVQNMHPTAPVTAQITNTGIIGTIQRYNTDPSVYPDPCERLANEPRLARFAFKENWELEFSVKTTQYTTLDNRRVSEPQFTVQLIGVVFDEMGEKTNGRYVRKQMIFFEDPDSALQVARDNNFDVDSMGERDFLNEMRYLRVRDWLFENFYPNQHTAKKQNKKQMVINNQVVEYYEISSVDTSPMPFGDLGNKLKA